MNWFLLSRSLDPNFVVVLVICPVGCSLVLRRPDFRVVRFVFIRVVWNVVAEVVEIRAFLFLVLCSRSTSISF